VRKKALPHEGKKKLLEGEGDSREEQEKRVLGKEGPIDLHFISSGKSMILRRPGEGPQKNLEQRFSVR